MATTQGYLPQHHQHHPQHQWHPSQQPSPMAHGHPHLEQNGHYMTSPMPWSNGQTLPYAAMSHPSPSAMSHPSPGHHQLSHYAFAPSALRPSSQASTPSGQPSPSIPISQSMNHHSPMTPVTLPPLGDYQQQRFAQPVPHQVVGQQGIRGVLPTVSGDPSSPDEACEPEQDEKDGSWPCKCCGKRYRHAKHLRRHHARHTGETPYECPLCMRRFGRSDVLKRHYHKCATRRGVTVGDHLAGQRGHPRRSKAAEQSGALSSVGSPVTTGPSDQQRHSHMLDGMSNAFNSHVP